MGPKSNGTAKQAPGQKPVAKDDATDPLLKRSVMPKGDVSRMLGYLKYHAKDSNKVKDDKSDASTALSTYSGLKGFDKTKFLAQYEANKGTLKWIHTFEATSTETETTTVLTINSYKHVCTLSLLYIYIYAYTYKYAYLYMYIYIYVYIYMSVYIYIYIFVVPVTVLFVKLMRRRVSAYMFLLSHVCVRHQPKTSGGPCTRSWPITASTRAP